MKCAMIKKATGEVVNMILADPAVDPVEDGCILVSVPDDSVVDQQYVWDAATSQFSPGPDLVATLQAQRDAVEAEAFGTGDS